MPFLTSLSACALALESPNPQGIVLCPEVRAAIERSPQNRDLLDIRDVECTTAEAQDLAAYFGSWSDACAERGIPLAAKCVAAEDAARHALTMHAGMDRPAMAVSEREKLAPSRRR